jgi:hypothetical protein
VDDPLGGDGPPADESADGGGESPNVALTGRDGRLAGSEADYQAAVRRFDDREES